MASTWKLPNGITDDEARALSQRAAYIRRRLQFGNDEQDRIKHPAHKCKEGDFERWRAFEEEGPVLCNELRSIEMKLGAGNEHPSVTVERLQRLRKLNAAIKENRDSYMRHIGMGWKYNDSKRKDLEMRYDEMNVERCYIAAEVSLDWTAKDLDRMEEASQRLPTYT